jgi:acyl-CoA thioester hydrolase
MAEPLLKTRVRYGETDQMRYAYHAHAAVWFDQARTELLRQAGHPYAKMEEQGWILPVLDLHVEYLKAAHFDDELSLYARLKPVLSKSGRMSRLRFRFHYEVKRGDELCYKGETEHCFLIEKDHTRHPVKVPDWLQCLLGECHD